MEKSEVGKLMSMMAALYTSYKIPSNPSELSFNVSVIHSILSDIDFEVAATAVRKYAATNTSGFAPSAGEIRRQAIELKTGRLDSPAEAWESVQKAIRRYGYPRPEEAMKTFDVVTRKVVIAMGWETLCQSEVPQVDRGQFIKLYETMKEREYADLMLPESVKEYTKTLIGKTFKALPEADDGET